MLFVDLIIPVILALREGLEAVLVIIIILLYLKKTEQQGYRKYVYFGAVLAIIMSIIFAIIFTVLIGGFTGILEEIFEGYTFIISGIFVITLVLWISNEGPRMKSKIEEKVEKSIRKEKLLALTTLTFVIILREGIELVLILTGTTAVGSLHIFEVMLGSMIGLGLAFLVGILIFYGVRTINLSKFFKITNIILILFAVGLITFGVHEFIEAGVMNPIIEEVWNIKHILPEAFPDGNPATLEFFEILGSLLKALFGYNANPSLLEVIIYPTLLISIGMLSLYLWKRGSKSTKISSEISDN